MKNHYVSVDKTELAFDLIGNHGAAFLSRPRRFGQSLFLGTLRQALMGKAKPFGGLKFARLGYAFEKYPVIGLDLAARSASRRTLGKAIRGLLEMAASGENLENGSLCPGFKRIGSKNMAKKSPSSFASTMTRSRAIWTILPWPKKTPRRLGLSTRP
ncbi:MAG: AAA family ATPase [Deltaproteobacteria bacterium]|nr:AAA family ATPase [Deltaproteobacteria bacterium]